MTYYRDWAAAISEEQRRLIIAASVAAASPMWWYLCVALAKATLPCDSFKDLREYRSYETLTPQVICFLPGPLSFPSLFPSSLSGFGVFYPLTPVLTLQPLGCYILVLIHSRFTLFWRLPLELLPSVWLTHDFQRMFGEALILYPLSRSSLSLFLSLSFSLSLSLSSFAVVIFLLLCL